MQLIQAKPIILLWRMADVSKIDSQLAIPSGPRAWKNESAQVQLHDLRNYLLCSSSASKVSVRLQYYCLGCLHMVRFLIAIALKAHWSCTMRPPPFSAPSFHFRAEESTAEVEKLGNVPETLQSIVVVQS